jgi:hypothetical protein
VQDATDTKLIPALILELDHLDPGLIAVSLAVIVTQGSCSLRRWQALLPEVLHRIGVEAVAVLVEDNPDDFPVVKAAVEGIQPGDFLAHRLGYTAGTAAGRHFDVVGPSPQHPLVADAAQEGADGVRVGLRFLRPLRGRAILTKEQWADDLLAPLGLIGEAEWSLCKRRGRFHRAPLTHHTIEGLM